MAVGSLVAPARFKTGPQVFVGSNGHLPFTYPNGLNSGRITRLSAYQSQLEVYFTEMLRDPTIKLAVDVITAMLMQQPWSVEGPNEEVCNYVWAQVEPNRKSIIRSSLRGYLRNGWRVFETAYGFANDTKLGMRQTVRGIKSLRASVTDVLVDSETGDVVGAENRADPYAPVIIDRDHIIFVNFDDEGYGDYGEALLRSAHRPWEKWNTCDAGAERYDAKIAGGFLHLKYPEGTTKYGEDATEVDNSIIAAEFLKAVRSSGYGSTPVKIDENDGDPKLLDAWKLEHVSASSSGQPAFIMRLKYLDALKLRVFGIPERSTTEGTFGTKAEAEAHADIAILVNLQRHERIIEAVNPYLIEPFNQSNFGEAGACRLKLGKLDPHDRDLFQTIFTALMGDPVLGDDVAKRVDIEMLLEKLDIPTIQVGDFSASPDNP